MCHVMLLCTLLLGVGRAEETEDKEEENPSFPRHPNGTLNYPHVQIITLVRNKAAVLPFFLGQLEELDYPKDKLTIRFATDHNADDSVRVLRSWTGQAKEFYRSITLLDHTLIPDPKWDSGRAEYPGESGPWDWPLERYRTVMRHKEEGLQAARNGGADYAWFLDADQFMLYPQTLQSLIGEQRPLIAPMMRALNSNYSNFWGAVGEDGYYIRSKDYFFILQRQTIGVFQVPMIHSNILVDLREPRSQQLSFQPRFENDGPEDDVMQLARSAREADLPMWVSNMARFGLLLEPSPTDATLEYEAEQVRWLALELLQEGPPGLLHSPFLQPFPGPETRLGFDRVYLINLERRPERRRRMEVAARILRLNLTHWPAFDGSKLAFSDLPGLGIRPMPEFLDPHGNRPLTLGEIGCFMSHYRVWEDVLKNGFESVLVLEDDLRFEKFFNQYVRAIFDDIQESNLEWDLIYLGRKRLDVDKEGRQVPDNPYLATVTYSYWTLAYALSRQGAEKLLNAKPLQALLPVDEYLPIMFDAHPQTKWASYFPNRKLKAFTTEPLLVHPTHYTGEPGHFSDTEAALIIPDALIPPKEEL